MGIAELFSGMRDELERHTVEITDLPKRVSAVKENSVTMSDFKKLRSMVGWHETEIAGLRQARLGTPSLTLSVPIYSGDRST